MTEPDVPGAAVPGPEGPGLEGPGPEVPGPAACAADRLELGEGARWINDRLYLVDLLAGRLLIADSEGEPGLRQVLQVDQSLGAVAARRDHPGTWLLATGTGIALADEQGHLEWLGRPEDDNPASVRMNDGAVDARGRFWAGSMADDGAVGAGSLYRVEHDGTIVRVLDGISIANGPAFSPDGRLMYLADSAAGAVDRFTIDEDGDLQSREPFVRFAEGEGSPDGMTVDMDGHLWLAVWGGGAVHRYRTDGSLERVVPVPATQPTSVCLGGPDGRRLFITSAMVGLTEPSAMDGALFSTVADVAGAPSLAAVLR